jgi:type IV pilus assembly protein PilV
MRKHNRSLGTKARGSSLLEVLVSILIMSFGILGVVGLHARAIQYSLDADDRNRAALFGDELAAQMRLARRVTLTAGELDTFTKRVQGLDLATNQPNGSGLPNATVAVNPGATPNVATLTITWRHPGQLAGQDSQFVMDIVLTEEEIA